MTPAAVAVIRAALEDAHHARLTHPADIAQRLVDALTRDGWTITPDQAENGPQRAA